MKLNLGCANIRRDDCINIDINPQSVADKILDMTKTPWIWKDNVIDGIYMFHFLEHTPDPIEILKECHRVLIPNGFLHITVPHSTSVIANGCLFHYQTFSYNSLKDYLSIHNKLFETIKQRIVYQPHYEWLPIQWFIDLSPRAFERFWGYLVGGAVEVMWRGTKI